MGGFWRFLGKRPLPSLITGQIRNQDPKIDQKKLVPKNPSKVDTYLTVPLVYSTPFKKKGEKGPRRLSMLSELLLDSYCCTVNVRVRTETP